MNLSTDRSTMALAEDAERALGTEETFFSLGREAGVTRLLTNLMHYCDEHGLLFDSCLRSAEHWHTEDDNDGNPEDYL